MPDDEKRHAMELARLSLRAAAVLRDGDVDAIAELVVPRAAPKDFLEWRNVKLEMERALAMRQGDVARQRALAVRRLHGLQEGDHASAFTPLLVVVSPERASGALFAVGAIGFASASLAFWFREDGTVRSFKASEGEDAHRVLWHLAEDQFRGTSRPSFSVDATGRPSERAHIVAAVGASRRDWAAALTEELLRIPCRDARAEALRSLMDVFERARERQLKGAPFSSLRDLGFEEPLQVGPYALTLEGAGTDAVVVATGTGVVHGDVIRISRDVPWPEPLVGRCAAER